MKKFFAKRIWNTVILLCFIFPFTLSAQIIVDSFGGWDGQAVSQHWVPVVIEVTNKGPAISGFIDIQHQGPIPESLALMKVDIGTQTHKRLWLYLPPRTFFNSLKVRLLNQNSRVVLENELQLSLYPLPSRLVAESIPSNWLKMGLSRAKPKAGPEWNATRILKQHLPDALVGYDGLSALHLGWSDLTDLTPAQRQALLDWVYFGGHLIVSAEDSNVWRSDPWWSQILPLEVLQQQTVPDLSPLAVWLESPHSSKKESQKEVAEEPEAISSPGPLATASAEFQMPQTETLVGTGALSHGNILIEREGIPLVVQARKGRGLVTQFLFNPGREPFRSWQKRNAFWLSLVQQRHSETDSILFNEPNASGSPANNRYIQDSVLDNFAINLLSTSQQRSLPWLLLSTVLLGYIFLIGPFDYVWLKRRRKLIWTWITFPFYVLLTSGVIYAIGYWTNAGDSEWKQWTLVDWLPDVPRQRAITLSGFYSTRNGYYRWSDAENTTTQVRELAFNSQKSGGWSHRMILATPSGSKVEAGIPIWTSAFFSGNFEQSEPGIQAKYDASTEELTLTNPTNKDWKDCRWVTGFQEYRSLGELKAGATKSWRLKEIQKQQIDTGLLSAVTSYYSHYDHYSGTQQNSIDLIHGLSFVPLLLQTHQVGCVDQVDLSSIWKSGDALFLAISEESSTWPWQLSFKPTRQNHFLMHRIYFSKDVTLASSNFSR